MSDHDESVDAGPQTLGERLRLAREAKGLSLDDVASRTRIPIRHLQNIEREDWEALPAITYAIGFTRNYANAVDLDGAALARELRGSIGGPTYRAAAPEYFEPADPSRVPPKWLVFVAILIAVALIAAYLLWRSSLRDATPAPSPVETTIVPAAPPAPAPAVAAPQAVAGQPVTLVATGDVWLQITDGPHGPTVRSGSMAAGERFAIPPTVQHPLLRTGRPQNLHTLVGATDLGPLRPVEQTVQNVSLRAEDLAAQPHP